MTYVGLSQCQCECMFVCLLTSVSFLLTGCSTRTERLSLTLATRFVYLTVFDFVLLFLGVSVYLFKDVLSMSYSFVLCTEMVLTRILRDRPRYNPALVHLFSTTAAFIAFGSWRKTFYATICWLWMWLLLLLVFLSSQSSHMMRAVACYARSLTWPFCSIFNGTNASTATMNEQSVKYQSA